VDEILEKLLRFATGEALRKLFLRQSEGQPGSLASHASRSFLAQGINLNAGLRMDVIDFFLSLAAEALQRSWSVVMEELVYPARRTKRPSGYRFCCRHTCAERPALA
jgi:hypothetical protein